MLRYVGINEINSLGRNPLQFKEQCEAEYEFMLQNTVRDILAAAHERPIVLVSGPSGSGKTTTALRLEAMLEKAGRPCHALSMDNYYFRPKDSSVPLDDEGRPDLESPAILDSGLLREHIKALMSGGTVDVPKFDFVAQRRADEYVSLTRGKDELIVVEGIHALNPEVVGVDAQRWCTGIYVSVRTRVKDANGFVLHPSKVRLLRRLMRDRRGRGQSFEDTISRLRSVNRGERLYIMPHKDRANISLDTFCPYELSVYRALLLDGLLGMDPEFMEDFDVSDVAPILRQFAPMDEEGIRKEALIREFIGGGLA